MSPQGERPVRYMQVRFANKPPTTTKEWSFFFMNRERGIKDVMIRLDRLRRVSSQKTVGEAVKDLKIKSTNSGFPFLLVVEKNKNREEILGTFSLANIMASIDLSINFHEQIPIFWRGQFLEECGAVLERHVFEVMSPIAHAVHENGTLMEALHLMISKDSNILAVLSGEDLVGILVKQNLMDEITRVIKHHPFVDPSTGSQN
jgi:CBS domain-containing protein